MFRVLLPALILSIMACNFCQARPKPERLANDEWWEIRSRNFNVITDAKPKLSEHFVRELEYFRFFLNVVTSKKLVDDLPPIKVLAIHKKSSFNRLQLPYKADGIFFQELEGNYVIANISKYSPKDTKPNAARKILFHEFVHYLSYNGGSLFYYPPWYREGIAEYYSTMSKEGNSISIGDAKSLSRRIQDIKNYRNLKLEELFKTNSLKKFKNQSSQDGILDFYARAWITTHYLLSDKNRHNALIKYLTLTNEGKKIDHAFKETFDMSFDALGEQITEYIRNKKVRVRTITFKDQSKWPNIELQTKQLETADFLYYLADHLLNHYQKNDPKITQSLLEKSLLLSPNNADAKIIKARWLRKNNQTKQAEKLLWDILKQNKKNGKARTELGYIFLDKASMHRLVGLPDSEELLYKARRQFRIAINNGEETAKAYYGLGNVYRLQNSNDSLQEGIIGYQSARYLYSSPKLLYREAILHLRLGQFSKAEPLLRVYSGGQSGDHLNRILYWLGLCQLHLLKNTKGNTVSNSEYHYKNGARYYGNLNSGKPHGKGKVTFANGISYEGDWVQGEANGHGVYRWAENLYCDCDFNKGTINGQGIYKNRKGIHKGEFHNGFFHGQGTYSKKDTTIKGQYIWNYINGPGLYSFTPGESYEVEWVDDRALITIEDNKKFSGYLNKQGKPNSKGTCLDSGSFEPYKCNYQNGQLLPD